MNYKAVYPGTFDPITLGHEDLIRRAARLFDTVIVAVADSSAKRPFFTRDERADMARRVLKDIANVEVVGFSGLLMKFIRQQKARVVIRGLRAISDFEYEMQMALMNRHLNPEVETVFMMPAEPYTYVSSRLVKEVAALGGSVTNLVPRLVEERLREKKHGRQTLRA